MYGTPGGETMEEAANPTFFIVIGLRLNLFSILKPYLYLVDTFLCDENLF